MDIVVFINPQQEMDVFWEDTITNMSEADKAAIEFALQLKEKQGGKVTAVAVGSDEAELALREAFAMGVDHAVWMKDEDPLTDEAVKIAVALRKINGDVLVSGRGDEVMRQVARALNIPQIGFSDLPEVQGLVIVQAENFKPRHMSIAGVYTAYEKTIEEIPSLVNLTEKDTKVQI